MAPRGLYALSDGPLITTAVEKHPSRDGSIGLELYSLASKVPIFTPSLSLPDLLIDHPPRARPPQP